MKITYYETATEFLAAAGGWLGGREAEHNLILGIAGNVARRAVEAEGAAVPAERRAVLLTVAEGDALVGAAVMTPPHRMILTAMSEAALHALAADLLRREAKLSGVLGEPRGAAVFAEIYARGTKQRVVPGRGERLYEIQLAGWCQPAPVAEGAMRRAGSGDMALANEWMAGFMRDALDSTPTTEAPRLADSAVSGGRLFFWEAAGKPVAMAAWSRPTRRGIAINAVYTPPEGRRHGYATAVVAQLTRYVLTPTEDGGMGKAFAVLFTDLANPISNSIYHKIGYRPAGDRQELDFR